MAASTAESFAVRLSESPAEMEVNQPMEVTKESTPISSGEEVANGDDELYSLGSELEDSPEPEGQVIPEVASVETVGSSVSNTGTQIKEGSTETKSGQQVSGNKAVDQSGKPQPAGKSKRKEDKSIDHILRALSSLQTTEEKLAALCKKYADLHEEHRILQTSAKDVQRKMTMVMREKEQLQTEHTKAVMARSKLEGLCRELQKHNRLIKEESLSRAKEEDEKRREISARFQSTIEEIQAQMNENHTRNNKLREENGELAGKLKKFIDEYELREQAIEKIKKHQDLQQQLADAKLAQANAILEEEKERNKREKELLFLQLAEGQKRIQAMEAQLGMYKSRYEEFQVTINKSNEMFQRFKTDMDKMGKRMKKLEKDGATWKAKWEGSNRALLEMAEEKARYDKERTVYTTKISKLESLCRALQGELRGRKSGGDAPAVADFEPEVEVKIPLSGNVPPTPTVPDGNAPESASSDHTASPHQNNQGVSSADPCSSDSSSLQEAVEDLEPFQENRLDGGEPFSHMSPADISCPVQIDLPSEPTAPSGVSEPTVSSETHVTSTIGPGEATVPLETHVMSALGHDEAAVPSETHVTPALECGSVEPTAAESGSAVAEPTDEIPPRLPFDHAAGDM